MEKNIRDELDPFGEEIWDDEDNKPLNRGYERGYVYLPYIMSFSVGEVSADFKPRMLIKNRYSV